LFILSHLIKYNAEIGLERSAIDGIHVVGRTLVHSRVHLGRRIYFELALDPVVSYGPLMNLQFALLGKS
jgi:hypothetical protein